MPIKYKKDLTDCIAHTDIGIFHYPRHFYRVYLWRNLAAIRQNVCEQEDIDDNCGALTTHARYCACFDDYGRQVNYGRRWLGEMHFIQGNWNLEYVAHECFHAANNVCKILNINPQLGIAYEERAAYIYGALVDDTYLWLWRQDGRNVRRKAKMERLRKLLERFMFWCNGEN